MPAGEGLEAVCSGRTFSAPFDQLLQGAQPLEATSHNVGTWALPFAAAYAGMVALKVASALKKQA